MDPKSPAQLEPLAGGICLDREDAKELLNYVDQLERAAGRPE